MICVATSFCLEVRAFLLFEMVVPTQSDNHFFDIYFLLIINVFPFVVLQGVPMIYMGDEYGHTKGGNNNTYCHDNYVTVYYHLKYYYSQM